MAELTDRNTALILTTNMLKEIAEESDSSTRDTALHGLAQRVVGLTEGKVRNGIQNAKPHLRASVEKEGGVSVIQFTEDEDVLFSASTSAQVVAELVVRGIRDYYTSSTMSGSAEWGWPSDSAQSEIERLFHRLNDMMRSAGLFDLTGEDDEFDVINAFIVNGVSQKLLAELINDALCGMLDIGILRSFWGRPERIS